MPIRMLEYLALLIQKYSDRETYQMVLYTGKGTPRMENYINRKNLSFSYKLKDIKEVYCKELMENHQLEDK